MKQQIASVIDRYSESFTNLSKYIGEHPELGHEEWEASSRLMDALRQHGFEVQSPVLELPTAFIGTYVSSKPGPTIAFLCEYDALPELGHACGHHLIGVMGLAAAVGLKAVIDEIGGTIRVYGTPAEETKGAKVLMAEAGMFDDVDIALMAHPYHSYEQSGTSLAMDAIQFEYHGKSAHAAASPYEGVNALDAVLLLFHSIAALRQQLRSHVRIHGIITEGGKAPNIIPDYAAAQFYIRSANRPYTDEVVQKVLHCAEGAALQTGCTMNWSNYEFSYDELITNRVLSDIFTHNLTSMGITKDSIESGKDHGSLDLGNVSRHCPTIHPYVKVVDERRLLHTKEFRDLAMLPRAFEGMLLAAKVLAFTAYDVITSPEVLHVIREEFERSIHSSH
ncbi:MULTISPECIES: M20 family metallopeptidase [unclassified Paenibacillus]|uniref:M20 family metallopeptidase n=1 Tax=unclassified Paenibacillus TaxID=185978 RepID=UPI001AE7BF09|nr:MULTISPECIES: M20 family metallopeptidase [unclassified Paenibacillus]MBP1155632.1 amidohydrolase [Paenibacillus sp. PvP091]MBP1168982.1 amidohydrolase [Paenibacillus sp. PvR098]MBP2440010.1 amidohydrolase [Paenibacillus sp. PvP052]